MPLNWNARLNLIIAPLSMASVGLTETPIAAFVLLLTNSNFNVGLASGLSGLSLFAASLPAGYAADRIGRQAVLRLASLLTLLSSGWFITVLVYFQRRVDSHVLFYMLLSSQFLNGLRRGIQQPALEAIFGDSIVSGQRSKLYAWRSSLRKLGAAVGPAVAAGVFFTFGDHWSEQELTWVLLGGAGLRLVPAALMWLFRDVRSLSTESEALHIQQRHDTAAAAAPHPALPPGATAHPAGAEPESIRGSTAATTVSATTVTDVAAEGDSGPPVAPPEPNSADGGSSTSAAWSGLGPQHVAPLLATADIVAKLGSGLSIRFFALYFWRELHLRPSTVCLVLIGNNVGGAFWTLVAQRASLVIGRVQVVLIAKALGIGTLVAIALSPLQHAALILPLYLLRTWLMNSPLALSKSVLNDYVPKKHRAKWASLESVNSSTWAGSACLGGFLSDAIGYRHTFLVTAALQTVALLLYTPLVCIVAKESWPSARKPHQRQQRDDRVAPLLAHASQHESTS